MLMHPDVRLFILWRLQRLEVSHCEEAKKKKHSFENRLVQMPVGTPTAVVHEGEFTPQQAERGGASLSTLLVTEAKRLVQVSGERLVYLTTCYVGVRRARLMLLGGSPLLCSVA